MAFSSSGAGSGAAVMAAILARVTPKALSEPAPDGAALQQILAAGEAAPDYGRLKPWRFVVVRGQGRQRLGQLMLQSALRRDPDLTEAEQQKELAKPLRAPLIILAACKMQDSAKVTTDEQVMAVSAAVQNMQLAAHALGFGAHWRTGPLMRDLQFKQELGLGLDSHDKLVAALYIGTIAQEGLPRAGYSAEHASRVVYWD